MNGIDAAIFTQIYQVIGFPATIVLMYWLADKWMKNQKSKTDADRKEHIEKWNTMVNTTTKSLEMQQEHHATQIDTLQKTHTVQMDKVFELHERSTATAERNSHNLAKMNEKLESIHSDIRKRTL